MQQVVYTESMELSTALIWALRILLPIILFCIYFKLQKGSEERYKGPRNNIHTREILLSHRQVVRSAPPSEGRIVLKDASQEPDLFPVSGGRRGAKGSRRQAGVARERHDNKSRLDISEGADNFSHLELDVEVEMSIEQSANERKMYMEALLNYVIFRRKEQQRVFLPATTGVPPPPPPPPSTKQNAADDEAEKANAEAQLVLRGAITLKRSDVALGIFEQLQEAQVELTAATFRLLIEACIRAIDLKKASDFLMMMEAAGHSPDTELLDMLMALYSDEKKEKDAKVAEAAHSLANGSDAASSMRLDFDGSRTKLVATAVEFVPTFPALLHSANGADVCEKNAEIFRTKLTAAAKPFEPKFNDNIVPAMPSWNGNAAEEKYFGQGGDLDLGWSDWNKGAGTERHKGKGKGKGKTEKGKNGGKIVNSRWKEQSDESWWGDAYWDSTWKDEADNYWDYTWKDESKKNGYHKHAKPTAEGKKSGGLMWRPKATNKEVDADVAN